jgi:hypothetical protein
LFWIIAASAGAILVIWLADGAIAAIPKALDWLRNARRRLGMESLPLLVFFFVAVMWSGLALTLFIGLGMLVLSVLWQLVPNMGDKAVLWEFRFKLAQLAVLTTVLGAVIALPITLTKLRLTREAGETAKDSLFNDKITEAAADLYAQRQVTRQEGESFVNVWEDDIVRRNAAIDRLFGLVEERPSEANRVSRLLSTYVRELSREHPPLRVPENTSPYALKKWALSLPPPRSDMENAVNALGSFTKQISELTSEELSIDLDHCNLQNMNLSDLDFQSASIRFVSASNTSFIATNLNGANLQGSELQVTYFKDASLRGTALYGARIDQTTDLSSASLHGSALLGTDLTNASHLMPHLHNTFGDGSTQLPENTNWPDHWPKNSLGVVTYLAELKKWRADPEGYVPPDPPAEDSMQD